MILDKVIICFLFSRFINCSIYKYSLCVQRLNCPPSRPKFFNPPQINSIPIKKIIVLIIRYFIFVPLNNLCPNENGNNGNIQQAFPVQYIKAPLNQEPKK